MSNPPPPPNDWRVLWRASLLIYLLVVVLMGFMLQQATKGGERFGASYAFGYWLLFGWPCTLAAVVCLHVLVLALFQERAYTLRSACWCGPTIALPGLLLLGMSLFGFGSNARVKDGSYPQQPPATLISGLVAAAELIGVVMVMAVALGLLLSLPHYLFYRRESRRA